MLKDLKTLLPTEPACRKRSDNDHLRFVIFQHGEQSASYDFSIELDGVRCWAVADVPSMDPLTYCTAAENPITSRGINELELVENPDCGKKTWDKGNYIPIDDLGNMLSEKQAMDCLEQGLLKFFLQGKKLVGEFVLMKKDNNWLLIKRHDDFALYNSFTLEVFSH